MSEYCCHIPFGKSLPLDNPYAVSVSFPNLQNVIDYEEGVAHVHQAMQSGYPRFFTNKYVAQLIHYVQQKNSISSNYILLAIASKQAKIILEYLTQTIFNYIEEDENVFLIIDKNDPKIPEYKAYVRNVGLLVSTRKAASTLYKLGQIENLFEEKKIEPEIAYQNITTVLATAYEVNKESVLLTNSGINAVFAASETILKARKLEGRNVIVQLGWLYLDTIEIIEKRSPNAFLQININQKEQLENWLASNYTQVASVITEVTTNPLIQCVDLPWLSNLCKKYNIVLIVDTTIATPFNINITPYCDIAVESLTKFASGGGDILMGAIILNLENPVVQKTKQAFLDFIIPPFEGELARLGFQIKNYHDRVLKIGNNTKLLYNHLKKQPYIKEIYSVFHADFLSNFEKIRKSNIATPGLISIVFDKDLEYYYDKLSLPKGPSLGTEFTLAMPYVYLAHYDYVKTQEGKDKLKALGLNSEILRISVGIEPIEDIIKAFDELL